MKIELNPGEHLCDECNGEGRTGFTIPNKHIRSYPIICNKCRGNGKLDWIENIVGKRGCYIKPGIYIQEVDLSSLKMEWVDRSSS